MLAIEKLKKVKYSYLYTVSVNPRSIHVDAKSPFLVKNHFIDLPTFELPDGSRPFKDFDYKNPQGTRVMGMLTKL